MLNHTFEMSQVGEFFKAFRYKHRITQQQLAERLGVQRPHIANTELNKIRYPLKLIQKLFPLLDYNEKEQLIEAIRIDSIDELNRVINELQKR